MDDEKRIQELINKLTDYRPELRWGPIEALSKIGKPAVPYLVDALKDENVFVGKGVADALGKIGDIRTIPALVSELNAKNWHMQCSAAEALGRIGFENISINDKILSLLILGKSNEVVAIGEPAVPALINALKDKNAFIRESTAEVLWTIAEKEVDISAAVPALIVALKDTRSDDVWDWAGEALLKIAEKLKDKGNPSDALKIVKTLTVHIIKEYNGKKDRDSLRERRFRLSYLVNLTQEIYDKMNPLDKREPIAWKRPRRSSKSVYKPFSSKTVYTR